jgi:16S rRNA (guanine527-N7)-methyltransferase
VFPELLRQKLAGVLKLSSGQIQVLQAHYELLLRWNRILNLTRVDSLEEAIERHYCESLFLAALLAPGPQQIADVGSGAGFPGIPVAVFRPDCTVALIESHQRKAVFLREATRNLPNVRVLSQRGKDIEERFDCVISRAVSYGDLGPVLKKLAMTADLLTGAEAPPPEWCFTWNNILLPWGRHRYLRVGVSRGTC